MPHAYIIDEAVRRLRRIGMDVDPDDIRWSGFYSQGDGLSFTGYMWSFARLFVASGCAKDNFPMTFKLLSGFSGELEFVMRRWPGGPYVHDLTVFGDMTYAEGFYDMAMGYDDVPVLFDILLAMDEALSDEVQELEEIFTDYLRGIMREIYRQLEDFYDEYEQETGAA